MLEDLSVSLPTQGGLLPQEGAPLGGSGGLLARDLVTRISGYSVTGIPSKAPCYGHPLLGEEAPTGDQRSWSELGIRQVSGVRGVIRGGDTFACQGFSLLSDGRGCSLCSVIIRH